MKPIQALTVLALAFSGPIAATTTSSADDMMKGIKPASVIELFTSQGCSSCPPADKLLGEYATRDDVLALSFNVDIWDWIGWEDTLASPDHTARQRAYARAMGERGIYTPQAVIDGRTHVVGSNRSAIETAMKASHGSIDVPLDVAISDDSISVTVGEADSGDMPNAVLWLVLFDREATVPIERGENAGSTITYHNVVKKLRPIAMWKGDEITFEQSRNEVDHADVDGCAFLLQVEADGGLPGPVLGAAYIPTDW